MKDRPRGNSNSRKPSVSSWNVRTAERGQKMQMLKVPRRKGARRR